MNTILEINKNEVVFIYNSEKFRDREALGYIKSVKDYKVKEIDISRNQLTETQLMDVADRLEASPAQLMDKHSDVYVNEYKEKNLGKEDVLTAIRQKPDLLQTPIALYSDKAYLVKTPYDLVKKGMSPKGIDPDEI
jgi:arsenate reductase-like glutaredoxin family protein